MLNLFKAKKKEKRKDIFHLKGALKGGLFDIGKGPTSRDEFHFLLRRSSITCVCLP